MEHSIIHIPTDKPKVKLDFQSLLQTLAILVTIIGYAFHQNERLTTLEVKEQLNSEIVKNITTTQQAMVKIFNDHLVSVASGGEVNNFRDLQERLKALEKKSGGIRE